MRPQELSAARQEFYSEALEMLEQMERLLPAMRAESQRGDASNEAVNGFFRLVHSLKGLSGMLGFSTISFLAHDLESLLAELRMGRLRFGEELAVLLEECLAAFSELLEAAASGGEHAVNVNRLLGRIEELVSSHRWLETLDLAEHLELPDALLGILTDYEKSRLSQHMRQGAGVWRLQVDFDFATFDVDLEELAKLIKGFGEVITTLPSGGGGAEDRIQFELLAVSPLEAAELGERLSESGARLLAVPYRRAPEPAAMSEPLAPAREADEPPVLRELQSVRVPLEKIDMALGAIGDLLLFKTQIAHLVDELRSHSGLGSLADGLVKGSRRMEKSILGLQDRIVQMRMLPVRSLFSRLAHLAQKLSRELGRQVELRTRGEDTELDKVVIDEMTDPLLHLVRNAIDHGIEPPQERERLGKPAAGRLQIRASHQGKRFVIEVEDDGRGLSGALIRRKAEERGLVGPDAVLEEQDVFGLLFRPGFSTRDSVTEISGRGVGLDIVRGQVVKLGGAIEIATRPGQGTHFTIVLPVTLAIIPSLVVRVADQTYAVPMSAISRTYDLVAGDVPGGIFDEGFDFEGAILPVYRLDQIFELEQGLAEPPPYLLVAHSAERRVGFLVHEIRGREEIVIKPLGPHLAQARGLAGATELGDGRPVLVLDVGALVDEVTAARAPAATEALP
jgi:two-component system, chemotaxis family, sensor kinase CheA